MWGAFRRKSLEGQDAVHPESEDYQALIDRGVTIARFTAATLACFTGQDPEVAALTAGNAARYNALAAVPALLEAASATAGVAKIVWELYVLTHEEEVQRTKEDICETVAQKLNCSPETVKLSYDVLMTASASVSVVRQKVLPFLVKVGKDVAKILTSNAPIPSGSGGKAPQKKAPQRNNLSKTALQTRDYIKEMETLSGTSIKTEQRLLLKQALQEKNFEKLSATDKVQHGSAYTKNARNALKEEWSLKTGKEWPTYEGVNTRTGKIDNIPYQVHHVIPQEVGGPHVWWNIHPVKGGSSHQGGVHGADSSLNKLLKGKE